MDGGFQVGQVLVRNGLQDRVSGIDVPVGKVVPDAGDLPSRDGRWVASSSSESALTASPISGSRIRTASDIRPSDRPSSLTRRLREALARHAVVLPAPCAARKYDSGLRPVSSAG